MKLDIDLLDGGEERVRGSDALLSPSGFSSRREPLSKDSCPSIFLAALMNESSEKDRRRAWILGDELDSDAESSAPFIMCACVEVKGTAQEPSGIRDIDKVGEFSQTIGAAPRFS